MKKKTVQQILDAMRAKQQNMETLLAKANVEKDQAKAEGYKALLAEEQAEFESLTAELNQAKAMKSVADTIKDAEDLAKVAPPVKGLDLSDENEGEDEGEGNDEGKTQGGKKRKPGSGVEFSTSKAKAYRELTTYTMDFLACKSVSDVARDAMAVPKDIIARGDEINSRLTVMLPPHMVANILNPQGAKALLSTDATAGVNSNAAELLAPDFRPQLLTRPVYVPNLYDRCRVIPAVNGKASWPKLDQTAGKRHGGVAFTWKATEGADKGETEPKFSDFEITTSELSGWTELSITMLNRSAIQLEALLTQLFQEAARDEFSKQILIGDGTNKPLGITKATGLASKARATAGEIGPKDLSKLAFGVSKGERAGGVYIMDDTAEAFLVDLQDGMERPLFRSSITDGPADRINGYTYETHEYGPVLGTKGDIIFGNLQQYAFAVEEQIAISRSDHAEFKKGRVVFRMITFVGGKPVYEDAFVALAA